MHATLDTRLKFAAALAVGALTTMHATFAADPAPPAATQGVPIMYLGRVQVMGEKNIFLTLQSIKVALLRPYSTNSKDADLVVCRIEKSMSEAVDYLDCDTNRNYAAQRDASQLAFMTAQGRSSGGGSNQISEMWNQTLASEEVMLANLVTSQPGHKLHVPVNGGAFHKLLDRLPMPAAVTAAPAAGSAGGPPGL